jgi:hypothetical protein
MKTLPFAGVAKHSRFVPIRVHSWIKLPHKTRILLLDRLLVDRIRSFPWH